jgi:hypothetical protein
MNSARPTTPCGLRRTGPDESPALRYASLLPGYVVDFAGLAQDKLRQAQGVRPKNVTLPSAIGITPLLREQVKGVCVCEFCVKILVLHQGFAV